MKQCFLLLMLCAGFQMLHAQSLTIQCGKNTITVPVNDKDSLGTIERRFFTDSTVILRLNDFSISGERNNWQLLFTYKGRGRMGEFLPFRGNNSLVIPDFNQYIRHTHPVAVLVTVVSASKRTMKVMLNIVDQK